MDTIVTPVTVITLDSTRIVHNIKADLVARYFPPVVRLVQYDQSLPVIAVSLMQNGQTYTLPSGAAANIRVHKPDATYVYNPALGCDSTRNIVYFEVTQAMSAANGDGLAIVEIVVDGDIAGTSLITLHFEENPVPEDAIESSDEWETIYELGERIIASTVTPVSTAAGMTDHNVVYLYTGTESGWNQGHMYYYNGTTWVDAGIAVTDTTLSVAGLAADAKKTGDEIADLKEDLNASFDCFKIAKPMSYTLSNDRVNIIFARWFVENNYLNRFILLKINSNAMSSANTWTLGTISDPSINIGNGVTSKAYEAVSLSGADVSMLTFIQGNSASGNFYVTTTQGVTKGQGGIIMLTMKQPITSTSITPYPDTSYPQELIDKTDNGINLFDLELKKEGYAWRVGQGIQQYNGYAYVQIRVVGGSSIAVSGASEAMSAFGYAIRDASGNVIESGAEPLGLIIDVPENGYLLIFSYKITDANNIKLTPYYKKKVVVLGDSWSDNDPEHTTYIKWTTLLQQDGRYSVKVYAQNGSTITGDTPTYAQNGNVAGQMEQFKADNIDNVDYIILFGGVNDFRASVTKEAISTKVESFYSTLNQMYPNARIIYIANHQIYITLEQLEYFHYTVEYLRTSVGMEAFTTFGWVMPNHYISDCVHVDNDGYRDLYANILSILTGGNINRFKVKAILPYSDSQTIQVFEDWATGYPKYSARSIIVTADLGKTYSFNLNATNGNLLASVPFVKILNKFSPSSINMPHSLLSCDASDTYSTANKMNKTNTMKLLTSSQNSGWYVSDTFN